MKLSIIAMAFLASITAASPTRRDEAVCLTEGRKPDYSSGVQIYKA